MSSYPGALDSFSTKVDAVTDVLAAHVNDLQDSIVAVQTELGTDPAGQSTDVAARLDTFLAEGTQTIWIPASAMKPEVTNGCGDLAQAELTAAQPERLGLPYDGAAAEYAQFSIGMPNKWDEGTITFIPFWTTTATDTDGVLWTLQAVALADGDALQTAFGTLQSSLDAGQSTANDVYVGPESSAITIAGTPAPGELSFFRMGRDPTDGGDTITEDCFLLGIKIMYTVDKGSDD